MRAFIIAAFVALFAAPAAPVMAGSAPVYNADGTKCIANCNAPTVKKTGKIPVWTVLKCVVGPAGGRYREIGCKNSKAVHIAPTGNEAVCFLGSDRKIHWDYQREVHVGRPFINRLKRGRWVVDWQDPPPY